jgi:hypothetical protein
MTNRVFFTTPARACVSDPTARLVAIKVGEPGFYPVTTSGLSPEMLNPKGTTDAVIEAAIIGAMFGWYVPGALPCLAFMDWLDARDERMVA